MSTAAQQASAGVYVTDDVGLEVTDGTASRVQLGLLPSGQYGLQLNGANLSGVISGSPPSITLGTPGVQLTDKGVEVSDGSVVRATLGNLGGSYGLKVTGANLSGVISGSPPAITLATTGTQLTDKGIEISDGTNIRATLGNLGGSYGLRIMQPGGSSSIIDGTSDVFKITAIGSVTCATVTNAVSAIATVTLSTGLTYAPCYAAWQQSGTSQAWATPVNSILGVTAGSAVRLGQVLNSWVDVVSVNQTKLSAQQSDATGFASGAHTVKFFIYVESAF